MRKRTSFWLSILLIAALLAGCGPSGNPEPTQTEPPATVETQEPAVSEPAATDDVPPETTTEAVPDEQETVNSEGNFTSEYVDAVYLNQIKRYYTALAERWDEDKYFDNGMSALPWHYYEGKALDNVGFGYLDLDYDGQNELIIGAILNADQDPTVFEIWTVADGEPVMLAQGGSGNRYVLQFLQEDNAWYVVNEASNGAASHATYYMMLMEGRLQVTQGLIFDATVDEQNPWYMTYDQDWDVSNDDPIDEDMANAIMDSNRSYYTALEYFPYSCCE